MTKNAVLALLCWRALRSVGPGGPRSWRWSAVGQALAVAALYTATDEFHQAFVPSQQVLVWDVLLDSNRALAGLLFLWVVGRLFRRW